MDDPVNAAAAPLSEEKWREWVRKGRLRDEAGARKRWRIATVLMIVVAIGTAAF